MLHVYIQCMAPSMWSHTKKKSAHIYTFISFFMWFRWIYLFRRQVYAHWWKVFVLCPETLQTWCKDTARITRRSVSPQVKFQQLPFMFYVKTWMSDHINDLTGHIHQHHFFKNCEKMHCCSNCRASLLDLVAAILNAI